MDSPSFLDLPPEMHFDIARRLPPEDRDALARTCAYMTVFMRTHIGAIARRVVGRNPQWDGKRVTSPRLQGVRYASLTPAGTIMTASECGYPVEFSCRTLRPCGEPLHVDRRGPVAVDMHTGAMAAVWNGRRWKGARVTMIPLGKRAMDAYAACVYDKRVLVLREHEITVHPLWDWAPKTRVPLPFIPQEGYDMVYDRKFGRVYVAGVVHDRGVGDAIYVLDATTLQCVFAVTLQGLLVGMDVDDDGCLVILEHRDGGCKVVIYSTPVREIPVPFDFSDSLVRSFKVGRDGDLIIVYDGGLQVIRTQ